MKFGGTSVQDPAAINQVAAIVAGRLNRRPVVVVSAMARVTDDLLSIACLAMEGRRDDAFRNLEEVKDRHLAAVSDLTSGAASKATGHDVAVQFAVLEELVRSVATLGELTPRSQDAIVSFGELLSSRIVTDAMKDRGIPAVLVDSRRLVVTDARFTAAGPDMGSTGRRVRDELIPRLEEGSVPIAQGFIGATPDGLTTTLGRGGSDYTAAIIGAGLGAESIEIWTDVDGLMTADPRVVPEARRIRVISFAEAAELSYFGAKVLHPSTVAPAVEKGIPVHVYNTRNPECEGTLIEAAPRRSRNLIKSIAFKRGVTIVNVSSTRMLMAYGFLRTIFEVFERHRTSVDVVTTSEVSVSMTLDNVERLEEISRDLEGIGEVTIERAKAIVCVVGDNLKFTPGVASRVFRAIQSCNVNMISQGASEINLTFVIEEGEVDRVVRMLHDEFFAEVDEEVFD